VERLERQIFPVYLTLVNEEQEFYGDKTSEPMKEDIEAIRSPKPSSKTNIIDVDDTLIKMQEMIDAREKKDPPDIVEVESTEDDESLKTIAPPEKKDFLVEIDEAMNIFFEGLKKLWELAEAEYMKESLTPYRQNAAEMKGLLETAIIPYSEQLIITIEDMMERDVAGETRSGSEMGGSESK